MDRNILLKLYSEKKLSVAAIAKKFNCSQNKINYWLSKYSIKKRTIAEAIYQLHNPKGDPFQLVMPKSLEEGILFGMGLGLYWGEGQKRGGGAVRLANSDIRLVSKFIEFLESAFLIKRIDLRFGLQVFSDISAEDSLNYWRKGLGVNKNQFYKTLILKVRGEGTYRYRSEHGVIILYFNNTKLRALICEMIDNIQ